ncbi:hypothetical protein ACJJTC_016953 [Scirpophaga incertulas]
MSHFGNFMDGVPVKISEKYKRPPGIDLPYSVHEYPFRAQYIVDNVKYCTTFETNVLKKIKELKSAKETKKNERRHRLQLIEEAKQKKLDAIAAAEAEERLKQLSVSEVSYPSTDEFSTLSPDEKVEQVCDAGLSTNAEIIEPPTDENIHPTCSIQDSQPNILQPIQVNANYSSNNLMDDPDPLQGLKINNKFAKVPQYSNIDTLTYKDFENDTSSPFDNVELKTINDMELLAQVLQNQTAPSTNCPQTNNPEQTYVPNCATQVQMEDMTYLPNPYVEQPIQGPSVMYLPPQYPISNGYYMSPETACTNNMHMDNMMYMPNYQYYVPNNMPSYGPIDTTYYNNQPMTPANFNPMSNGSAYIPQPYYFHGSQPSYPDNLTYSMGQDQRQTEETQNISNSSQNTIKSRSRSVPDIVKELNEEIASAKQRAKEKLNNINPAVNNVPGPSKGAKKEDKKQRRRAENLPNPFDKMPPAMQGMCQKIHGMGFPLDRVARVCGLLGDNDKKVIEGLLILGELMDLGFSEGKVLAALAKHSFSRDKALDELVT